MKKIFFQNIWKAIEQLVSCAQSDLDGQNLVEFKNSKSVKAKDVEKALNAIMKIY